MSGDFDWEISDQTLQNMRDDFEKFAKENPNHPRVLAGRKAQAERAAKQQPQDTQPQK